MRRLLAIAAAIAVLSACEREERQFRAPPVGTEGEAPVTLSSISPGTDPPERPADTGNAYEENAYHLSEGKRLFTWFNCNGCHANGGGGSGPALMDDSWIYGGALRNIVQTIREGRPNGMPSFRGKIPEEQITQIAAYVRSMERQVPQDAAPGRNDDLMPRPSEHRLPATPPAPGGTAPPSGQAPQ
ncbi:c-type cytochrome (plasmid) [Sinorhizobium medicae WSM1115]|uniref:c-type cytochrome n=1 Tax=Sinorhizobium medicae TaxID=110321 RepID=UPI00037D41DE|nr:c-type cytochrome [Sinorhizobium medicae]UFX06531.1 c-type cytochrome [Sinorhizobium medicae WSM1115]